MAEHKISIQNRIAVADAGIELVCNNPTDTIRFEFDAEWSGIVAKTARFSWEGKRIDVLFSGNVVEVPEIFQTNYVFVGVFTDKMATTPAKVKCRYSIKCLGGKVPAPSKDVYDEVIALVNEGIAEVEGVKKDVSDIQNYAPRPFEASGNPVQLENFEGMPMDVVQTFAPAQLGSGDPYPAGGGRNLLPFAVTGNTVTARGITATFDNEGCVINGTPEIQYPSPFVVNKSEYPLEPGNYYISGGKKPDFYLQIEVTRNGTKEWHVNKSFTIYGDETGYRISITCAKEAGTITFDNYRIKPMLVKGTEAPEEYQSYSNIRPISGYDKLELTLADEIEDRNTYTVHLGDTIYGGTYDWGKGALVVDIGGIALEGTEGWELQDDKYYVLRDSSLQSLSLPNGQDAYCISSHFKNITWREGSNSGAIGINGTYGIRAYVLKLFPTLDDWKAYLAAQYAADTSVQIAYKLATPITIQLTPQQITALAGVNTLYGDVGEMVVSGRKDILWLTSYLLKQNAELKNAIISLGGNV